MGGAAAEIHAGGLSLAQARAIVDGALAHSERVGLKPMTIMVLDAAGVPIAFNRQDGAAWLRHDIAKAKAWGVLAMGVGGRELARHAERAPGLFALLGHLSDGKIAAAPGGVIVRAPDGGVLGSIGVCGDSPDHDEACAVEGCRLAGVVADTGDEPTLTRAI